MSYTSHCTPPDTLERRLERADRKDVITLLESISIQCYDSESDLELKTALLENVKDETIDSSYVFEALN